MYHNLPNQLLLMNIQSIPNTPHAMKSTILFFKLISSFTMEFSMKWIGLIVCVYPKIITQAARSSGSRIENCHFTIITGY